MPLSRGEETNRNPSEEGKKQIETPLKLGKTLSRGKRSQARETPLRRITYAQCG